VKYSLREYGPDEYIRPDKESKDAYSEKVTSIQRVQWLIRALCVLGLFVSGYLTWTHLDDSDPYCGASHSCADVQDSAYSEIAGIPVSVIGMAGYVILLAFSLLRGRADPEIAFYLPVFSFGFALIGVLYSAYLTYLEAVVIQAWCYWCVASALIITAIFVLTIYDLFQAWTGEESSYGHG
jgi:uncharacterized membrane protein